MIKPGPKTNSPQTKIVRKFLRSVLISDLTRQGIRVTTLRDKRSTSPKARKIA